MVAKNKTKKEENKIQRTNIEWVKNPDNITQGYSWNPLTGCLNHANGMCKGGNFPCYAYKLARGRLKQRYLANKNYAPPPEHVLLPNLGFYEFDPFYPRFWPERIPENYWVSPDGIGKGIFVCDMGELFGDWIPREWQEEVFKVIKANPDCRFYLLTKCPWNLPKWSPFPQNVYLGVTATNDKMAEEAGFWLWEVRAKVKFVSFEPLLERIPLHFADYISEDVQGINWVIIGAQTKPSKPPKLEWVKEVVVAADKAGIPVFLKDNLLELVNYKSPETDFAFNKEGYYRQEMPK